MARWKMTTVVERFLDPKNQVPRERLACGHVRTDPMFNYGNEKALQIKRAFETLSPGTPVKARCYKCAPDRVVLGPNYKAPITGPCVVTDKI